MPLHIKRNGEYNPELTELEQQIVKAFEQHIELMLQDEWYITIKFAKMPAEDDCMETLAKPEYRTAEVTVDTEGIGAQPEYINNYVRHELLHVLVWSFFDIAGTLSYKNSKDALIKLEEEVIGRLEHMPLWKKIYMNKTVLLEEDDDAEAAV
jgi:hypothetical protein